ncbi:MAG: hypothetical protein ABIH65_00915 [Nanoarchaeota archaeon]
MKTQNLKIIFGLILLVFALNLTSAVIVNVNYVTLYSGEEGKISLEIENNENFDIEDISINLILEDLPFTAIGTSQKDIDNLDEDDDDSVTFTIKPSTDIIPGDYSIPYLIKYVNADDNLENFTKTGSFGIRVSAKTDLDFSVETRETAILGKEGELSLNIINLGLGEIKSVSVQIFPQGFTLLSVDKIFIGTIDADDSDTATFDVIYTNQNPQLSAKISYKDFDNNDQIEIVNLPFKVYTEKQALELGLIQRNNTIQYILIVFVLSIIWYIWRKIRKRRKQKLANKR